MTSYSLLPLNYRRGLEFANRWLYPEADEVWRDLWREGDLKTPLSFSGKNIPFVPDMDVSETDKGFIVLMDLPGLEEKDISVEISHHILSVKGEKSINREEKGKKFHRMERMSGSFSRSLQLPPAINSNDVEASFKDGVLTITIPKSPEAQNQVKHIAINKAEGK